MPGPEETTWCSGCGVEITWSPIMIDGHPYCCLNCVEKFACDCGEYLEMEDDRRPADPIGKIEPLAGK